MNHMLRATSSLLSRPPARCYTTLRGYQLPVWSAKYINSVRPEDAAGVILDSIHNFSVHEVSKPTPRTLRLFQSPEFGLNGYPLSSLSLALAGLEGGMRHTWSANGSAPIGAERFLGIGRHIADAFHKMSDGTAICLSAAITFDGEPTVNPEPACSAALFLTSGSKQVAYIQPKQKHSTEDGLKREQVQGMERLQRTANPPVQLIHIPGPDGEGITTAKILQCLDLEKADAAPPSDIILYPARGGPLGHEAKAVETTAIVSTDPFFDAAGLWIADPHGKIRPDDGSYFPGKLLHRILGPEIHDFFYPNWAPSSERIVRVSAAGPPSESGICYLGEIDLTSIKKHNRPRTVDDACERAFPGKQGRCR